MFKRVFVALSTIACAVAAKTTNFNPQYAVMAIDTKWQLFLMETLFTKMELTKFVDQLKPIKADMYEQIAAGKADLKTLVTDLNKFINSVDDQSAGFKANLPTYYSNNKLSVYTIATPSPEESWDFVYYSLNAAAKEVKQDKITKNLAALNNELEPIFRGDAAVDVKAVVNKIDKFTLEADTIWPSYTTLFIGIAERELTTYQNNVQLVIKGQPLPPTQAPFASSTGSSATETETPSASSNETATEPSAPAATTKTPDATPAASAGTRVSSVVTVSASAFAVVVSYLTL